MHNEVLVYRGNEVESKHAFTYVVSTPEGKVSPGSSTIDKMVFPRSAIKLFQVLPFITSGAFAASNSSDKEISIACGSHNAEEAHVSCVNGWLETNKLTPKSLACGSGLPRLNEDIKFVYENKIPLSPAYNNCSGKHTAMLLTCKHLGWDLSSYHLASHPLQKQILQIIESFCGHKLDENRVGIDGCALPNYMMSLKDLSVAAAKFAFCAEKNTNEIDKACNQVLTAIHKYPYMIAGRERLCTDIATVTEGRIIAKVGAEGVYMAIVRDKNLGITLKVEDGSFRAVEVALVHLLKKYSLLKDSELKALAKWFEIPIFNTLNERVGKISAII
jgi:L-asparaginase II